MSLGAALRASPGWELGSSNSQKYKNIFSGFFSKEIVQTRSHYPLSEATLSSCSYSVPMPGYRVSFIL